MTNKSFERAKAIRSDIEALQEHLTQISRRLNVTSKPEIVIFNDSAGNRGGEYLQLYFLPCTIDELYLHYKMAVQNKIIDLEAQFNEL